MRIFSTLLGEKRSTRPKKSLITPTPKSHSSVDARDFRPISVTSTLCRLVEKLTKEKLRQDFKKLKNLRKF